MSEVPLRSMYRRDFLGKLGKVSLGAAAMGQLVAPTAQARPQSVEKSWEPVSGRKVRVGIVGYGVCQFGAGFDAYQPGANRYDSEFSDEMALFQTSEGGSSRMLMCKGIHGYVIEQGRVFGERGWMEGTHYQGAAKDLPDISRPALPPGMPAGGHGGSHGRLANEFITAILEDGEPLVNVYEALAMTVPGIVAHQSAMKDGETLNVPQFARPGAANAG